MPAKLYQVDAFTDIPFSGNPAAVRQEIGIEMDFPAVPAKSADISADFLAALGEEAIDTLQAGNKHLIVVDGEDRVRRNAYSLLRKAWGKILGEAFS